MGAQLQDIALSLAAVEGLAVHKALEVEDQGIAHFRSAVHGGDTGVALGHAVQLGINLLVGDVDLSLGNLQALVLAQGHFGIQSGFDGQNDGAVLFLVQVNDGGHAHGVQLLLHNGLLIDLGEQLIDGVLKEHLSAVHTLDDLAGGLALAEAGDGDVLAVLQIGLVEAVLKGILGNRNYDFGIAVLFLNALYVHWCIPPMWWAAGGQPYCTELYAVLF